MEDLLDLADCYLETVLLERCEQFMLGHLTTDHCCVFYQLAKQHRLKTLESRVIEWIAELNLETSCLSDQFAKLDPELCKQLVIDASKKQRGRKVEKLNLEVSEPLPVPIRPTYRWEVPLNIHVNLPQIPEEHNRHLHYSPSYLFASSSSSFPPTHHNPHPVQVFPRR